MPSALLRRGKVPQKIYWEGINLNKISKKIVSAVTMGAFALTLVPAAAFAAPNVANQNGITIGQDKIGYVNVKFADIKDQLTDVTITVDNTATPGVDSYDMFAADGTTDLNYKTGSNITTVKDTYNTEVAVEEGGEYKVEVKAGEQVLATETFDVIGVASATNSYLVSYDNNTAVTTVSVDENEAAPVELVVRDAANQITEDKILNNAGAYVYVWATKVGSNELVAANFTNGSATTVDKSNLNDRIWRLNKGDDPVGNGDAINVAFPAAADYVIHMAVADKAVGAGTTAVAAFNAGGAQYTEFQTLTVKVAAPEVVTNSVTFADATSSDNYHWYLDLDDNVTPSDTKMYTVKGVAWEGASDYAENTDLTLQCDDNGDGITLEKTTVSTDAKGNFSIKFTLSETAVYSINILNENGKVIGVLIIDQDDVNAATIDIAKDGGTMLAGNDATYSAGVYGNGDVTFGDAVQFEITDVYGQVSEGGLVLKDEYAASEDPADAVKHAENLRIVDKPKATETTAASTLEASDLVLAWDGSAYTLKYVGDNYAKDLVPGEYKVRVALNNGGDNAVTVSFTLAKFGEIESIDFNLTAAPRTADSYDDNAIQAIDDQVALGQYVSVKPEYVDVNGIHVTIPAKNYDAAVTGKAVDTSNTTFGNFNFTTRYNTVANESLIGSEVTVQVFDKNLGYQTKTLTIVSAYLNETLAFDSEQGPVGESNLVNVTVVDENGNLSKVNGTLSARVESQSNEEATIDVDVNKAVKNGAGKIYVESDAEGTADIVVAVKADNGEMYAKTLTYTFGDEDPYAGTSVVMTIGSDQYLINNELFDGSVDNLGAPYVDSAWRTMVPARILAETFGGTVEFDEVDGVQTVSIVNGDTTIEMTVGSADYTINGEAAKAMDTEPVIVDGRTYVPVRFVAEGLGLDVTPLYDAETGTTASVVFQK